MVRRGGRTRERAARGLAELLEAKFFKALCEPVRVEIVKILSAKGRCDVTTIAEHFPQDSSVVSRHLAILHDAGVVRREKEGRHVFFELDGPSMVERMEKILDRFRQVVAVCWPAKKE
jgi:DNA-binding transcriptional ArsR family regulator